MHLATSIVQQFVVSLVLLTIMGGCRAMRYSRSMRYMSPSVRNYKHQWKYAPFSTLPRSMQRRFMWKDVDDTVDELMGGFASGARAMTQMFPPMGRYRSPLDYDSQSTSKIKYVIKKPPPPFKRMKVMKFRAPKKTIPLYHPPLVNIPSAAPLISMPPEKPNMVFPFMSQDELRQIEKEQEQRVENVHDHEIHEHSHQTHMDADVISGRINEFGEGWMPVQVPYATSKTFARSQLHTKVEASATIMPSSSATPTIHYDPNESRSYQVTEHSAEESVQQEQAFKPSNHFDFLRGTTELPNYPDYFLKNLQAVEDQFEPTRIPTTTTTTTTVTPTLSNRLPPRSTTERPFKRYNLHRPKSSKLFFNRPTSSPDPTKQVQTTSVADQTTTFIAKLPPVIEDVIKTTRETVRTTRTPVKTTHEPNRSTREPLRTTKETPKVSAVKVRTIRNDSEAKSKIKIKKATSNESPNTFLSRGTVKFGEKQS